MNRTSGHLVIISPGLNRPWKAHFGKAALWAASLAVITPLLLFALAGYTLPPPVNETERIRLETENNALRTENKNLEFKVQKLSTKLESLEQMSWGIVGLLGSD